MKHDKKKIAIDLLWLRPGKVGGTEFFIRNLLDGLMELKDDFYFSLLVSKDNEKTFDKYITDSRFEKIIVNIESANIVKRILWQNLFQNITLHKNGISKCFVPVYCRPFWNGGISYISVIHDIQAYHFPRYHPLHEVWYSKLCWLVDKYFSKHIVAISQFVKDDLLKVYKMKDEKISVVHNPVNLLVDKEDWETAEQKYGIERNQYYYTIGQIIPHKNIDTLIRVFDQIKKEKGDIPDKLLVSGISGNATKKIEALIEELDMSENVILTGFVSEEVKVALYKNARAFLFPSVFEGFGIPPIEAMMCGSSVITTKCASIPEVTQNKANYVEDPYNVNEWIEAMKKGVNHSEGMDFECYSTQTIARKYLAILNRYFNVS